MNGNKYKFLLIALVGIILWNTPGTVSLLADSHAFYNGSAPCSKCHADVLAQLEDTGSVTAIHRNLDGEGGCRSCHSNPINIQGTTIDYHSAYRPNCIECHKNVSSINNYQEAHSLIFSEANRSSQNLGLNEACVLCHTTLVSEIVVRDRVVFPFESDSIAANGSVEYNGTYTTTISNPEPTGLHNFNSGVQCIMCHAPVQELLDQSDDPYPEHREFGCTGCHRGSGMVAGQTNETRTEYHAAKIKYCSDCHDLGDHEPLISRDCNLCHESHGGLKVNRSV